MKTIGSRSVMLALFAILLLCPAAGASTATFARITLDQGEGRAGSTVSGKGEGFDHWSLEPAPDRIGGEDGLEGTPTNPGPVRIHWNATEGAVVWEGPPGLDGEFSFSFRVPPGASPGEYTVVARQTGYDGKPTGGSPARVTFRVTSPAAASTTPTRRRERPTRPVRDAGERAAKPQDRIPSAGPIPVASDRQGGFGGSAAADPRAAKPRAGQRAATRGPLRAAPRTTVRSDAAQRRAADARGVEQRHAFSWTLVAAFAIGGALGAGGAWVALRRRRGGTSPQPAVVVPPFASGPDEIEAALQELLAEERVRAQARDTVGAPPT